MENYGQGLKGSFDPGMVALSVIPTLGRLKLEGEWELMTTFAGCVGKWILDKMREHTDRCHFEQKANITDTRAKYLSAEETH